MFDFLLRPLRRNFGRDKEYYRQIDDMFGFIPNNIELYKLALIHKSASFVLPDGGQMNNERLEYLGDAIIEAVTSDYLYIEFPEKPEGFLTQLRSKIVSRHSLNLLAERIGLDRLLVAHAGATLAQKHIYGDAFEAMIGAIYLDQGYDFTNRLLINYIYANFLDMETLSEEETDFKSRLIEWCQKNHHTIRFETKLTSGNRFLSTIFIDDMEVSHGRGTSKKESEQHAAQTMAQSVTDSACLRMLDKLDKIDLQDSEAQLTPAKEKKNKVAKPNQEQKETKEQKVQKEQKNEKTTDEPKSESPVKGARKEVKEPKMPKEPKREAETPAENLPFEQEQKPLKAEENAEQEKPKVKRPRRMPKRERPAEETTAVETSAPKVDAPEKIVEATPGEDKPVSEEHVPQPERPKRPRSRRTPKAKTQSDKVSESGNVPPHESEEAVVAPERPSVDGGVVEPASEKAE